ncbi:MAG: glycyl-radical enzyme activating protein [Planctomycetota bacterium]|nr:glycyl-radical enzyme activating protein [Planctomycetota bacterium]
MPESPDRGAPPVGMVFDIKRFAVHDGPGIRTTVFLKGCPLRCIWCHNPESMLHRSEIALHPDKCIHCGRCLDACPLEDDKKLDREYCTGCGACAEVCPSGARVLCGRELSVDEVMAEAVSDKAFYDNSGGGVTVSGGEPLTQPDFAREILHSCRAESMHTVLDTTGYADWEILAEVAPQADLVLYDLKCADPRQHRELTGVSNEVILENAGRLAKTGKPMIVRIPVIPGYTDSPENIGNIGKFVTSLGDSVRSVELLPYNRLAEAKYHQYGYSDYKLEGLAPPGRGELLTLAKILTSRGIRVYFSGDPANPQVQAHD